MALDFTVRDVIHHITAKFTRAFLPNAQKPYNLRAIHGSGLKVEGDAAQVGLFFEAPDGARVKAKALAVNEPRHLTAIATATLAVGRRTTWSSSPRVRPRLRGIS